uniref:Uncharacterized protein n=1 Tax=Fusarium oxysporum (strain Fo5176) TaxID=660025 RepID=A0A0D2Y6J8_FUSOF
MKVSFGDLNVLVEAAGVASSDGPESSRSAGALLRPPGGWARELVQLRRGRICEGDFRGSQFYNLDESFKLVFRLNSDLGRLYRSRSDVKEGQAEREVVGASGEMVLDGSFGQWHIGEGQINRVAVWICRDI